MHTQPLQGFFLHQHTMASEGEISNILSTCLRFLRLSAIAEDHTTPLTINVFRIKPRRCRGHLLFCCLWFFSRKNVQQLFTYSYPNAIFTFSTNGSITRQFHRALCIICSCLEILLFLRSAVLHLLHNIYITFSIIKYIREYLFGVQTLL